MCECFLAIAKWRIPRNRAATVYTNGTTAKPPNVMIIPLSHNFTCYGLFTCMYFVRYTDGNSSQTNEVKKKKWHGALANSSWMYENKCYLGVWMELCHSWVRIWWPFEPRLMVHRPYVPKFFSICIHFNQVWSNNANMKQSNRMGLGCKWNCHFKFSKKKEKHLVEMKSIRAKWKCIFSWNFYNALRCTLRCTRVELTWSVVNFVVCWTCPRST